jgi:hypothetical protein
MAAVARWALLLLLGLALLAPAALAADNKNKDKDKDKDKEKSPPPIVPASSCRPVAAATVTLVTSFTRRRVVPTTADASAVTASAGRLVPTTTTAFSVTRAGAAFTQQRRGLLQEHHGVPHLHRAGDLPQEVQAVVPHGLRDLQTHLR